MNSTKTKKKSKSAKLPKPIKIKKEDDHIMYPMEHYVDDRVELIRQIFSSLKPKTITNLAPEFLKKNKLEDIQEQCLNEILGISKKRLLSIINSTKCPTDTETSSDDEINIEEHISLEEISSDSDIAEQKGLRTSRSDGKKKQKVKSEIDNENNKQFSVLELLELQARARAIRSQLALEPVTKIEVDTDSDEEEAASKKSKPAAASRKKSDKSKNGRATVSKPDASKRAATATLTVIKPNGDSASNAPTKRIKLKRNFRKQTRDGDSNDESKTTSTSEKKTEIVEPKKEARSPSPDVIPIISVPETLCISDSDDENVVAKEGSKEKASVSSQKIQILSVVNIEAPRKLPESPETKDKSSESPKETVPIEAEEGEILEKDEKSVDPVSGEKEEKAADAKVKDSNVADSNNVNKEQPMDSASVEQKIAQVLVSKQEIVESSDSDDDTNDDVISLEGGDLLNEMKEHLEDDVEETTPAEDIICLDDSSEEETVDKKSTESWNERWLKSNKVSKVLAASRLGNRVRNKIKESKKAKKLEEAAVIEQEQMKPQEVLFTSRHEDGSVEQYKELLETMQKKTD